MLSSNLLLPVACYYAMETYLISSFVFAVLLPARVTVPLCANQLISCNVENVLPDRGHRMHNRESTSRQWDHLKRPSLRRIVTLALSTSNTSKRDLIS